MGRVIMLGRKKPSPELHWEPAPPSAVAGAVRINAVTAAEAAGVRDAVATSPTAA
jgi:hypothetical protein